MIHNFNIPRQERDLLTQVDPTPDQTELEERQKYQQMLLELCSNPVYPNGSIQTQCSKKTATGYFLSAEVTKDSIKPVFLFQRTGEGDLLVALSDTLIEGNWAIYEEGKDLLSLPSQEDQIRIQQIVHAISTLTPKSQQGSDEIQYPGDFMPGCFGTTW